jgi:TonB family protein
MILPVLQSSVILFIAFAGFHLLRRKSAALRHLVLTVALFAAVIVPFAGRLVPEHTRQSVVFTRVQRETQQFLKLDDNLDRPVAELIQPVVASSRRSFASDIWIVGVFIVSVFMLTRMLHIIRLKRRSVRVTQPRWQSVASELCNAFRIRRPVRLLQSESNILGTLGLFRPCILLPREAGNWSEDRIRVVLSHELAHIKRFDWLIQIAAELTCAVCWFNPLFWWLGRQLRAQGEHACDDVVLNGGVHANDYAAHLLELARSLRASESAWSPVVAMARPPYLERRFVAMLNPSVNRKPAGRTAVLTTCLVAVLMMAPLIVIGAQQRAQPIAAISEIVPAPAVAPTLKAAEPAAKPPVRKAPAKPAAVQGLADGSLSGTVTDGTGAVVPKVSVTVSSLTLTAHSTSETEAQTTTSDETGKYNFAALTPGQYSLKAEVPGFAAFRTIVAIEVSKTATQNVMLSVGSVMQRVTVTAAGQPKQGPPPGVPQRIRVGGNVIAANLISQVRPVYPESARDAGIEGTVHLQGLIGTDGLLLGLTPLNNINRDLTAAALDAVRQWQYRPTLLNNEPVQVLTTIDVEFKLAQ